MQIARIQIWRLAGAIQFKAKLFRGRQIPFDFSISLRRLPDQVHRKDAEFAKVEFFVLSGERPESTKA